MKGDFSRDTFDPLKHFSRVLMQQGRVQLDADWNEQTSILLHYLRTLAKDILGPAAAFGDGFKIDIGSNNRATTLKIGPGNCYVDGILCENSNNEVTFDNQPNLPGYTFESLISALETQSRYLVYLDVWERHITGLEDGSIRETALGGADTASRTEVIWQVKISEKAFSDCTKAGLYFKSKNENKCKLAARVHHDQINESPCSISPEVKYRGLENHLYRVEIHNGSNTPNPTFKWSRENGSIVVMCRTIEGSNITVDSTDGFHVGNCIEITSDYLELRGEPGVLAEIVSMDGNRISLTEGRSLSEEAQSGKIKIRRWDMEFNEVNKDGITVRPKNGEHVVWESIEHNIQISFQQGFNCQSGDYWLIPARVVSGDIEWSEDEERIPHGVEHHYAPLAFLEFDSNSESWKATNIGKIDNSSDYNECEKLLRRRPKQ